MRWKREQRRKGKWNVGQWRRGGGGWEEVRERKDGKGSNVYLQVLFNNESGPSSFTIIEPTTRGRSKSFDFKKALTFIFDYKLLQTEWSNQIFTFGRKEHFVPFCRAHEVQSFRCLLSAVLKRPSSVCRNACADVLPGFAGCFGYHNSSGNAHHLNALKASS